jgi:hypothetical protein
VGHAMIVDTFLQHLWSANAKANFVRRELPFNTSGMTLSVGQYAWNNDWVRATSVGGAALRPRVVDVNNSHPLVGVFIHQDVRTLLIVLLCQLTNSLIG